MAIVIDIDYCMNMALSIFIVALVWLAFSMALALVIGHFIMAGLIVALVMISLGWAIRTKRIQFI